MTKLLKNISTIVLLLFSILTLCSPAGAEQVTNPLTHSVTEAPKPVVYRTVTGKFSNLNPHKCVNEQDIAVVNLTTEGLIGTVYDDSLGSWKYIPIEAVDFPDSKDNKVWTFKLRDGIRFSDGTEINADIYLESWKRLLDPNLKNRNAMLLFELIDVKGALDYYTGEAEWKDVGFFAKDERTVIVTLETPASKVEVYDVFSKSFMSPIVPELYDSFLDATKSETKYGMVSNQVVSNGAYKIENLIRDKRCVLIKNESSVAAKYKTIDRMEFTVSTDFDKNLNALINGEIDSFQITNNAYRGTVKDTVSLKSYGGSVWGIAFNSESRKKILPYSEFRKALMYSIDSEEIVMKIFKSFKPVKYVISDSYIVGDIINGHGVPYRDTEQGKRMDRNPGKDIEQAKALFSDALQNSGEKTPLILNLSYPEGQATMRDFAVMIKNQAESVFGEDMLSIKLIPVANQEEFTEWDITLRAVTGSHANPWSMMKQFSDSYSEELAEKVKTAYQMTTDERAELLGDMESAVMDKAEFIPVFQNDGLFLWSDRFMLPKGAFIPGFGFGITQAHQK